MSRENLLSESEAPRQPERLTLLTFCSQGENTLLHKFVLDNCPPKLDARSITAALRSMSADLPVNRLNRDGLNPLHIVIWKRNALMVERLFSCIGNMDINAPTSRGRTPIQQAVRTENVEVVEILLRNGADINECLLYAARTDKWSIVKELLHRGNFVNIVDDKNKSLLHWAAKKGNLDMARQLISLDFEIDAKDIRGCTALYLSTYSRRRDVFEELLAKTGDISNDVNRTLLHCSAICGSLAWVRKSLLLGCDVDAKDDGGETALLLAARNRHWDVVRELLSRNASVNVACEVWGRSPLHWAAEDGKVAIVKQILLLGGKIDAKDYCGHTARVLAVKNRHDEIAQLLSSHESVTDRNNDEAL